MFYEYEYAQPLRTSWAKHWTNGGTGLTILSDESAEQHRESLRLWGKPDVWIEADDYAGYTQALHSNKQCCSDYWRFHNARLGK